MRRFPYSFVMLSVFLVACGEKRRHAHVEPDPVEAVVHHGDVVELPPGSALRQRLRVEAVSPETVHKDIEAPAQIEADPSKLVRITPPVPGRVVQLFIRFGDNVRANQPLLTLDSADMVHAQTEFLQARSHLAQAERTMARQRDLVEHGIGAQRDFETAQTEEQIATQELERSEERLRLYGLSAGHIGGALTIRSPIAGRVVDFHVAPGEFHADPSDVLMTVADLATVWVTADIQEKDIRHVHQGAEAKVTLPAYPNEEWRGSVLFVGDILDPDTRTLEVRIALDNANRRLHPGMFASVSFAEIAESKILVPTTAIILHGDASYVFVETSPYHYARRRVTLGEAIGERTIVEDGLRPGDRIVATNAVMLQ